MKIIRYALVISIAALAVTLMKYYLVSGQQTQAEVPEVSSVDKESLRRENLNDARIELHPGIESRIAALYKNKVSVYEIDYSNVIYVETEQSSGGSAILMDATLEAWLHIGYVAKEQDISLIIVQLENIDLSLGNDDGFAVELDELREMEDRLTIPFAVEYDDGGVIQNIRLSPEEGEFSSGVKRSIAGRLQFKLDINIDKPQLESNEFGRYIAVYGNPQSGEHIKNIKAYTELARSSQASASHKLIDQNYIGQYLLDNSGGLDFLSATSSVRTDIELMTILANTELTAHWLDFSDRKFSMNQLQGYKSSQLHYFESSSERSTSEKRIAADDEINGSQFLKELEEVLQSADEEKIWALRDTFIQSIMQDPSNLEGLENLLSSGLEANDRAFLLGALTDAQTPQTQLKLAQLATDKSISPEVRSHVLSHMALISKPTEATVDTLSELVADAQLNKQVKQTAVLALGGVLRSASDTGEAQYRVDSNTLEGAKNRLLDGLTSASDFDQQNLYLMGLGNAGLKSTEDNLLNISNSDNASMRAAAVDSLRFVSGEAVDNRMATLITSDSELEVRVSAINSTVYRGESSSIDQALLETLAGSSADAEKIAALSALDLRGNESQEFARQIELLAASEDNEQVRDFANNIVQRRAREQSFND